jgi:hypothetical protein
VLWDEDLAYHLEDRMAKITGHALHLASPKLLDMNGKKRAAEIIFQGIEGLNHV